MKPLWPFLFLLLGTTCCSKRPVDTSCVDLQFFSNQPPRKFSMGFSTWLYAARQDARTATYAFINQHADIYSEQIDQHIPWKALLNNEPLPASFVDDISQRIALRPAGKKLLLSVSVLNINRTDLLEDVDGSVPAYSSLGDPQIAQAYYNFLVYLIGRFQPAYLVIGMEVNELLLKEPNKWAGYTQLADAVKQKLRATHPGLPVSESVTLHSWLRQANSSGYMAQMKAYVNSMDFAAISFYPFLNSLHRPEEIRNALDFLNREVSVPIAFSETAQIAEPLSVPSFGIKEEGTPCGQNDYLRELLTTAQEHQYLFLIWWCHRDYDELLQIFPESTRDLGRIWRDTGLLNESGAERPAFTTWQQVLDH